MFSVYAKLNTYKDGNGMEMYKAAGYWIPLSGQKEWSK